MISIPHSSIPFSQKHGSNIPYPHTSWFPNYMPHAGHPANNQFLNSGQPSIGSATNGILDTDATAQYAHYHMLQQSSPDWTHDPYGLPTPGSQFYPNGMTPSSMHLSPTNNQHNTSGGSENLQTTLTHIPPSPPVTVNSGCSEMSSPGINSNGIGNHMGNDDASPNLSTSELNLSRSKSPFEWMKKPSYQSQPNPGKTRTKDKYRVVYTDYQRLELEKEYHMSHYITIRRKSELAQSLQLSERQVKIWFQNRRAKDRKQTKKTSVNPQNGSILPNGCANVPLSLQHHNMGGPGMGYGLDIKPKLEPGLSLSGHHPHQYYGIHHHGHPMHQLSSMGMSLLNSSHMQTSAAAVTASTSGGLVPTSSTISSPTASSVASTLASQ